MHAIIKTSKGDINLELYPQHTPVTVTNFVVLAQQGYYDGLTFHRVIEEFMVQGGCPYGTGTGGPGYQFHDEFHPELRHRGPGILSMANAGPNTNGSQFFITHIETSRLDNKHTVFGAVHNEKDQHIVNSIQQNDSIETIIIKDDTTALLEQMDEFVQTILRSVEK